MLFLRISLPLVIIALCYGAMVLLVNSREKPELKKTEPYVPFVEIVEAQSETEQIEVRSQGTVQAKTQTLLTSEVSGKVLSISDNFRPGAFFKQGEILVQVDPADYEARVTEREAQLAEAQVNLLETEALAEQALKDWSALGEGEPSDLVLRKPQMLRAQAAIKSAEAGLEQAQRDLERTFIRAPYAGIVLEKSVDVGQFVSGQPGTQLGRIFSVEVAEIRLPISLEETAFIDLPHNFQMQGRASTTFPKVDFLGKYNGKEQRWGGRVMRVEASIDTQSRLMFLIAEVVDPYGLESADKEQAPMILGMFVEARIEGMVLPDAIRIPRTALIDDVTVLVVDAEESTEKTHR